MVKGEKVVYCNENKMVQQLEQPECASIEEKAGAIEGSPWTMVHER
jgi:hypothetical protein